MKKKTTVLAILCMIGCNAFWSFSFLFTKTTLDYTTPFTLLAHRFVLSFLIMNLLLLTGKFKLHLKGVKFGKLLLLGLFEPIIYFILNHYGLLYASSSFTGMMSALLPGMTLFTSAILLKEKANKLQILFASISIICLIVLVYDSTAIGSTSIKGAILIILSMFGSLGFGIVMRSSSVDLSPFDRTYAMFMIASVVFSAIAIGENIQDPIKLIAPFANLSYTLQLLYLGGLCGVAAYLMVNFAMSHLPLYRTTSFANLRPAISAAAGIIFLHEPFSAVTLICAVITIACVFCIQKFASKDEPTEYVKKNS